MEPMWKRRGDDSPGCLDGREVERHGKIHIVSAGSRRLVRVKPELREEPAVGGKLQLGRLQRTVSLERGLK